LLITLGLLKNLIEPGFFGKPVALAGMGLPGLVVNDFKHSSTLTADVFLWHRHT
jgi:hypothetical protein